MTQLVKQKRFRLTQIKFFVACSVAGVLLMIGSFLLGTELVSVLADLGRALFTVGLVLFILALGGWELQPRRSDAEIREMVVKALTSALENPSRESPDSAVVATTHAKEHGSNHA